MNWNPFSAEHSRHGGWLFLTTLLGLAMVVALLFRDSLNPNLVLFANDGPLGAISSEAIQMPGTFSGYWHDLNWLGYEQPSASPGIYMALGLLLQKPVLYLKFCTPICLVILGCCTWYFLRCLRLCNAACFLGALAAALNMEVVSYACWGLPSRALTMATAFLACGLIVRSFEEHKWIRLALAGLAIGLGLMEGYDVGALFSLYIAVFLVFSALTRDENGSPARRLGMGVAGVGVMAVFAAYVSVQTLSTLFETQIQGAATGQTREQRWDFATQWSLPKLEAMRIVIPGLFGYRLETPTEYDRDKLRDLDGGNYWGSVGQDPLVERLHEVLQLEQEAGGSITPFHLSQSLGIPQENATQLQALAHQYQKNPNLPGLMNRHSGSGEYAGILTVFLAALALALARSATGPFSELQKSAIFFWGGMALVSLLLAFGRYAFFYQIIHPLPFFDTMRNTIKFLHPMHFSLVILFSYGVHGLLAIAVGQGQADERTRAAWAKGLGAIGGTLLLVTLIFTAFFKGELDTHLRDLGFQAPAQMASFVIGEIGISSFMLLIVIGIAASTFWRPEWFGGRKTRRLCAALTLISVFDLTRASTPWVQYYDYKYKYEGANPLLERLSKQSYMGRVCLSPMPSGMLDQIYKIEWAQHQFLYHNIQSLDLVQMPRKAERHALFEEAFNPLNDTNRVWLVGRRLELTNTRFVLGASNQLASLNVQLDPGKERFVTSTNFSLVPKQNTQIQSAKDITTLLHPEGSYALYRFNGALPRVKLYSNWQSVPDDEQVLARLASREFDPWKTLLVSSGPQPPALEAANVEPGTTAILSYTPKNIRLQTEVKTESVLLLNDARAPDWRVFVDGEQRELLRCNYIMRGVRLEPGNHEVVFKFEPSLTALYVSLSALLVGVGFLGFLLLDGRRKPPGTEIPDPA